MTNNNDAWHTEALRLTRRRAEQYTPRERAALRGWSVEPSLTSGPGHVWMNCDCRTRSRGRSYCPCGCHGRAYVHYRRGG